MAGADRLAGLQLIFAAAQPALADALNAALESVVGVSVHHGSILDVDADAVVSPANSFGFMDGGIDAQYVEYFGRQVQDEVRRAILTRHDGELLVGEAEMVPTGHRRISWLIAAPTMRVPTQLPADTINPFLALRAVLRLWQNGLLSDRTPIRDVIGTIAIPGLGTGVGRVPAVTFARQSVAAIEVSRSQPRLPQSWADASWEHQLLYTDQPGRLQPWH